MPSESKKTWLDRSISWLSPQWGLERAKARAAASILFAYEGARTDRRVSGWHTADTSANAEIGPYLSRLRQRSRDLVRNNAYATNALDELAGQAVGTGITAQAKPKDPELARQINEAWNIWVDECDADGQLDFYGLQDLAVRTVVESGEVLVRRRLRYSSDGYRIPMQIQILEPDYLDTGKTEETKTGRIIQGVEFDLLGNRIAYWMFPSHPGDVATGFSRSDLTSRRTPAVDVLHVYRKKRQQVRGAPWIAPVITTMRDEDEYTEAELVRKKIEACFASFITQEEGPGVMAVGETETNDSGQIEETLEPGMIKYLKPGEDVKFAEPAGSGSGYREFKRDIQTKMAVGIGITYEMLTGDLSNVNYSSYRAGMLSFRTKMEQFRWLCFIPMFCKPVRGWFINAAYAAGLISARDYLTQWSPPRYGSIDPQKEALAIQTSIRNGIKTWPQAVGEEGYDPDEQIAEIQEANKKLDEAGIVLDCDSRQRTATGGSITQSEPQQKQQGDEGQ
jgi:lambda family phage portal protein